MQSQLQYRIFYLLIFEIMFFVGLQIKCVVTHAATVPYAVTSAYHDKATYGPLTGLDHQIIFNCCVLTTTKK